MKVKVFNLIILDASGSMQSIKKQAIDSMNETLQTIRSAQEKHEDQEHNISFVVFNDEVSTIYDCVDCREAKEISECDYTPMNCTALYDAMGMSLTRLRKKVGENDRVLVTIITDGYENASHEYTGASIKALVEELRACGWVFAFIGANQDVEKTAATISITNCMSFAATPCGTSFMSKRLNRSRMRFYDRLSAVKFDAVLENDSFFDNDVDKC